MHKSEKHAIFSMKKGARSAATGQEGNKIFASRRMMINHSGNSDSSGASGRQVVGRNEERCDGPMHPRQWLLRSPMAGGRSLKRYKVWAAAERRCRSQLLLVARLAWVAARADGSTGVGPVLKACVSLSK